MIPRLSLTDIDGNVYTFPVPFFLDSEQLAVRSSIKSLLYSHGGRDVADKFVGPRKIGISGELKELDEDAFETSYRAMMKAAMKGGKLRITNDVIDRYIEVESPEVDPQWTFFPRARQIGITFNAPFPLWRDSTEITFSQVVAGNETLTIDLSSSDHIVMPVIEIDADQGVAVPSVEFRNVSDGGLTFLYNNAAFTAGAVLTIDCENGMILLNSNDAIDSFVSGAFPRLQPRSNTVYYEGAACTIKFKYRKVYL